VATSTATAAAALAGGWGGRPAAGTESAVAATDGGAVHR